MFDFKCLLLHHHDGHINILKLCEKLWKYCEYFKIGYLNFRQIVVKYSALRSNIFSTLFPRHLEHSIGRLPPPRNVSPSS